jgi:predicted nucleic acid-binding Zn ribbon protein
VLPVQNIASGVLAEILRRQPSSRERTAFAWTVVAGPAVARAATVDMRDGILYVTPKDDRWTRELHRAGDSLLTRLQALLGPELREVRVLSAPRSPNLEPRY